MERRDIRNDHGDIVGTYDPAQKALIVKHRYTCPRTGRHLSKFVAIPLEPLLSDQSVVAQPVEPPTRPMRRP